jgi:hypothetical protein
MNKFVSSDWLRAVQFFSKTVPKNAVPKNEIVQISLTSFSNKQSLV